MPVGPVHVQPSHRSNESHAHAVGGHRNLPTFVCPARGLWRKGCVQNGGVEVLDVQGDFAVSDAHFVDVRLVV